MQRHSAYTPSSASLILLASGHAGLLSIEVAIRRLEEPLIGITSPHKTRAPGSQNKRCT